MIVRRNKILACTAVVGLAATGTTLASAQDDSVAQGGTTVQDTDASREQPVNIEEITVTARKREESLQQTPVAITAFTATDIEDRDIRRIQEITSSVPTLQFDNAVGNASSARIYLRGVGNGDPISSDDPGVGIYLDGVFLPRAQGAVLTVSDVQQVEVLRGPQGTLFGKNTIGGAVSITSKKPDPSEFFGNASVRIGNYDRFDTRLAVNIPLIPEKAATRLSFATATRDGFAKNKSTGRDFSDDKLLAGRAQFLFLPTDSLELNLSIDRSIENRAPFGGKCKVANTLASPSIGLGRIPDGNTVGEFTVGAVTAASAVADLNMDGQLSLAEVDVNGNGINDTAPSAVSFATSAALTGVSDTDAGTISGIIFDGGVPGVNNLIQSCAQDDARDERSIASDLTSSKNNLETWGTNLNIKYDLGDMTFKSISSWRRNENTTRIDNDYTELNFAQASANAGDDIQDAFSQEFQLTGTAMDGRLNYVVGLYGFSEDIRGEAIGGLSTTSIFPVANNLRLENSTVPGATSPITLLGNGGPAALLARFPRAQINVGCSGAVSSGNALFPAGVPATAVLMAPACIGLFGAITQGTLRVKNQGLAGYTQGTYDINDALSVTIGARLTSERKRVRNRVLALTDGFVGGDARSAGEVDFEFERSERFSDISPLVNLSYQLTDETLLYTTFSKGFKSGGFNGRANDPLLTGGIDDEKLTSYEVGFKTSFLDNRVVVNGAAYWSIYEDIQLTIPMGVNGQASIAVLNAGEAEIKGGELEVRARVLPNLDITGSLGVVNSRYTSFDDPANSNADNRRLLATPNYTGNLAASYMLPLGGLGDMRLRAEWTHRGKSGTDVVDSDVLRKGKNGELDATITLAMADGVTEIVLFGNNLLDREYFTNGVNLNGSLGIAYRFYNDPRTYGIEIRRQF